MTEIVVIGVIWLGILGISVAYWLSRVESDKRWKQEAIDRGFAEYDSVTGEWRWKESNL